MDQNLCESKKLYEDKYGWPKIPDGCKTLNILSVNFLSQIHIIVSVYDAFHIYLYSNKFIQKN